MNRLEWDKVGKEMIIFFNGSVMRGEPLHGNLAGTTFLREDQTARAYRLFSLGGDTYPGMIRIGPVPGAISVPGELYEVPPDRLQAILDGEPPFLYLGEVELISGEIVKGILCEEDKARLHPEISSFGGWRKYRRCLKEKSVP